MDVIWKRSSGTAENVREALATRHPMKDSTTRTVLKRLEEKGYLEHRVEGRTNVYRGLTAPQNVAVRAVRQIIDRFCRGSVEELVSGMVDARVLSKGEMDRLEEFVRSRKQDGGKQKERGK